MGLAIYGNCNCVTHEPINKKMDIITLELVAEQFRQLEHLGNF